jgi:hypothetical protein
LQIDLGDVLMYLLVGCFLYWFTLKLNQEHIFNFVFWLSVAVSTCQNQLRMDFCHMYVLNTYLFLLTS